MSALMVSRHIGRPDKGFYIKAQVFHIFADPLATAFFMLIFEKVGRQRESRRPPPIVGAATAARFKDRAVISGP